MELRPYQTECLDALAQQFIIEDKRRLLVVLPTGSGKTVVFAELPKMFSGSQTLVLAHRTELIRQSAEKLLSANPGLHVSIEQATSRARPDADIIVASIQTLARAKRRERFSQSKFGLVVVDEAHHCANGNTYHTILKDLGVFDNGPKLLGVTATPFRSSGESLASFFEAVAFEKFLPDMIDEGWLAPFSAYSVYTKTSLDGVKTKGGDFQEQALAERVNTETRNLEIVRAYQKLAAGRHATLVFAVNVQHAKDLLAAFRAADITSEMVLGETDDHERATTFRRFVNCELPVLINVGVATEGTDLPATDCVLLARPTKSSLLITQMIGRGSRLYPEKQDCLLLDMVDNTSKHKLATSATVLGLPSNVNAKGNDLRKLKKAIKGFSDEFPGVDLETPKEITMEWIDQKRSQLKDLMARSSTRVDATSVSLFGKVDPKVKKISPLTWIQLYDGSLKLRIPPKKGGTENINVGIRKDASDHFLVEHFDSEAFSFSAQPETFTTIEQAVEFADGQVRRLYGDRLTLLNDKASWHRKPATDKQRSFIRSLGGVDTPILSSGEAARMIDQLQSLRETAPPTSKQAYFLRQNGYDPTRFTRRQASAVIAKSRSTHNM